MLNPWCNPIIFVIQHNQRIFILLKIEGPTFCNSLDMQNGDIHKIILVNIRYPKCYAKYECRNDNLCGSNIW